MRRLFSLLSLIILLSTAPGEVYAGFLVNKRAALVSSEKVAATGRIAATSEKPALRNFIPYEGYYPQKQNQWYGIAAMISGVLGLLIPGVNFLAILFGVLGMGRRCKAPGLAVAGFVLGVAELIIFLLTSSTFFALVLF